MKSTSPNPNGSGDSASNPEVVQVGPAQILEILGKITDKLDAHDRMIKALAAQGQMSSVQVPNMAPMQGGQLPPGASFIPTPQAAPGEPPAWLGPIIQAILPKVLPGILGPQTSEMDKLAAEVTRVATMKQAFDTFNPPKGLADRLGERLVLQVLSRIPGLATLTEKSEIAKQLGELSTEAAGH